MIDSLKSGTSFAISSQEIRQDLRQALQLNIQKPFTILCDAPIKRTLELIQLKQWDLEHFHAWVLPYQEEWISYLREQQARREAPFHKALALIKHPFSKSTLQWIQTYLESPENPHVPLPEELFEFFYINDPLPHFGQSEPRYEIDFDPMHGCINWKLIYWSILKDKLELLNPHGIESICPGYHQEKLEMHTPAIDKILTRIRTQYDAYVTALFEKEARVSIPNDPEIRSLITQPIPIILSSDHLKPTPFNRDIPLEYLLEKAPLGERGVNILFTDTNESRKRIYSILPEDLKKQIKIYLFDAFQVNGIPLMHAPHQVEPIPYYT